MTALNTKANNEAQIRALVDDRVKAVRERDINRAMSYIAPDVLVFDVVNPLQFSGADGLRKRAQEWFSSFDGPINFEISEPHISAGDDVAFSHTLNHVSAVKKGGAKLDMWWRSTVCYSKIDSKWLVTHEHDSVPFDPATGKASLDLQPQRDTGSAGALARRGGKAQTVFRN